MIASCASQPSDHGSQSQTSTMLEVIDVGRKVIDLIEDAEGGRYSKGPLLGTLGNMTIADTVDDACIKEKEVFYMEPMDFGGGHLNDVEEMEELEKSKNLVLSFKKETKTIAMEDFSRSLVERNDEALLEPRVVILEDVVKRRPPTSVKEGTSLGGRRSPDFDDFQDDSAYGQVGRFAKAWKTTSAVIVVAKAGRNL